MSRVLLFSLSAELLLRVFSNLPPKEILRLQLLCRRVRTVIRDSGAFYNKLNPSSLKREGRTEEGKASAKDAQGDENPVIRNDGFFDFSGLKARKTTIAPGSVFTNDPYQSVNFSLNGRQILAEERRGPGNEFSYTSLKSIDGNLADGGIELKWEKLPGEREILGVGMGNVEHDLVAVIRESLQDGSDGPQATEIELLRLSTGKPHESAKQAVLKGPEYEDEAYLSARIVGENIAVFFMLSGPEGGDEVCVYKWKTGELVLKIVKDYFTYWEVDFLNEDILVLPNLKENTLEFWRIPSAHEPASFDKQAPFYRLQLPIRASGAGGGDDDEDECDDDYDDDDDEPKRKVNISCIGRFIPKLDRTGDSGGYSPEKSVYALDICLGESRYCLVVRRQALLGMLPKTTKTKKPKTQKPVPWDKWGPKIARWIPVPEGEHIAAFGQRVVHTLSMDADTGTKLDSKDSKSPLRARTLVMYDFDPDKVKDVSVNETSPKVVEVVVTESKESCAELFDREAVKSSLSYVKITSGEEWGFDPKGSLMMNEEMIVGIGKTKAEILRFI